MGELNFSIGSGLKNIIGRDLITDDFIAVYELVKNSYDAHAKKVKIYFEEDLIRITDDGKGMNLTELKTKWLRVAYSAKKDGTEDADIQGLSADYREKIQEKRHYAGAKGIGRFSCDRLGGFLRLTTKKAEPNARIESIVVDWTRFEMDSQKDFIDIPVEHETICQAKLSDFTHGTVIEIAGLNSTWDEPKLKSLRRSLEKLINPVDGKDSTHSNDDFDIEIIASEFDESVNGPIRNFIFETLALKTTQLQVEFSGDMIRSVLIDRGELIYEISERNIEFALLTDELDKVVFRVFYLNRAAKRNFTMLMGLKPVQFGSIFLFKNGFRVLPYGEFGIDILGMDSRKSQAYARHLGTREVIGRMELFGESKEFREVSSRDGGLVKTKAYEKLIDAFRKRCLERLEKYVVGVQWAYSEDPNLVEDKNSEDLSLLDNFQSKARIIQLISNLVSSENVELINYSKNFLNIVNERIEDAPPGVFSQLARLAESTDDFEFAKKIRDVEAEYKEALREKEEAEELANRAELARAEAEAARMIAEQNAANELVARLAAEAKAREEESKKKQAELLAMQEQQRRKESELREKEEKLRRLEAEEKRKAEENRRKEAELRAIEEAQKAIAEATLRAEAERNAETANAQKAQRESQVKWLQSIQSLEITDVLELHHQIGIDSNSILQEIETTRRKFVKKGMLAPDEIQSVFERITLLTQKIRAVAKFTTKSGFLQASRDSEGDIIEFIQNYVSQIYSVNASRPLKITFGGDWDAQFVTSFKPIEITIVLDNLFNNSKKHLANSANLEFRIDKGSGSLVIEYTDDGPGLDKSILDPSVIFGQGFTTTKGSGLGLFHTEKIILAMNGRIEAQQGKVFKLIITLNR